jgi:hypothetical protein
MRVLRGLAGALLWILASVVGLVAVLLCATIILLPVGIPLLFLTRRMFTASVRLFLPRAAAHPIKNAGKSAASDVENVVHGLGDRLSSVPRHGRRARKRMRKATKRFEKLASA